MRNEEKGKGKSMGEEQGQNANGANVRNNAYEKRILKRNKVLNVMIVAFAAIAACFFIASATLFICGRGDATNERYIRACLCLFFAGISLLVSTSCLFLKTTQRSVKRCAVCGAFSAKKSAFCCACGAAFEKANGSENSNGSGGERCAEEDGSGGGEN